MRIAKIASLLFITLAPACSTTQTYSRTYARPWGVYQPVGWVRRGYVENIREDVRRQEGNPAGGALAGALIGGFLGGRGPSALIGAAGGAAVGAAASQGTTESRTYSLVVRFDDGNVQTFVFNGYPPFRPGESVALTAQGLGHG